MKEPLSLAELHAAWYPAASQGFRSYGVRSSYTVSQTCKLDWTPILVRLHERGYVVPGPTIGRTSYWLLTSKYNEWYVGMRHDLARIVGKPWTVAVMGYIYASAIQGPRLSKPFRAAWNASDLHPGACRYAFRLVDEPTPWLRSIKSKKRLVSGQAPDRWRSIPWIVPNDLQERASRSDQSSVVNDDATPQEIQDAERIETINAGLSANLSTKALHSAIEELETIAKRAGQLPSIKSRTFAILDGAMAFYHQVVEKFIRERLRQAGPNSTKKWYDDMEEAIATIDSRNLRESLEELLSQTKERFRQQER